MYKFLDVDIAYPTSLTCKLYELFFVDIMFPAIVGNSLMSVAPSSLSGVDGGKDIFLNISLPVSFVSIMIPTSLFISIMFEPGSICLIIADAMLSMVCKSRSDVILR